MPKKSKNKTNSQLKFDPTLAVRTLSLQDPILAKLMKKVGPFNLKPKSISSPFHALAESIVYQQLNRNAASTIFGRVCELFDSPEVLCPQKVSSISEELLRSAGLSRSKLASIKDLADKMMAGLVPKPDDLHQMSDDEIVECLTKIRGIGNWTVEMMLIFRLGRMDVLPINDYGVRKGFALTFGREELPTPKELLQYGERWRPYRSVASWYLWRSLELN